MTKNKIKPLKTPISEILFLMFCFGACTLTLSPGPHNNRNPKPSTLENRISLLHNALNPVLKCLFLQCFSNINQICPQNRPLTKTITLHNAQNKAECFRNGLLWKMKTFMLTKTHNWKNEKTKLRKGIWKDKTKQETPKNRNKLMKRNLSNVIFFRETNAKKQGKKKQQKNKEGENQQESKEKTKKTRNKIERDREWKRKSERSQGEKKGRHWEMNKITRFQGKNSVFVKDKKHKILRRVEGQQPQNTRAGFFCCPFGLLMVTYRLRIPRSLQKCHSSCFFFYFRCFVFLLLGGCVSFFVSMFVFIVFFAFDFVVFFLHFSLCDQKTRSNHRISEMFILMFCFGACILAFSLGPAKNPY